MPSSLRTPLEPTVNHQPNPCKASTEAETSSINRISTKHRWGGWGSNPGPTDYECLLGGLPWVQRNASPQVRSLRVPRRTFRSHGELRPKLRPRGRWQPAAHYDRETFSASPARRPKRRQAKPATTPPPLAVWVEVPKRPWTCPAVVMCPRFRVGGCVRGGAAPVREA
jgi:hypothetical protein